ncbi:MAG TPA: hypothetical protein VGR67_12145 [Candidatus Polarisedimenticolia bacterium]|jgi:hypothetical protein|nr:hypothetical protein [Candidatus Polarisedimenticolia bacterium]
MVAVTGIFKSRADAEGAVERLRRIGIEGKRQLNLLMPGATDQEIAQIPTSDAEQPGMGAAVGGVVGGASAMAIGSAATSLLIPGIGLVAAVGIVASGLLGAFAGAAAGGALEDSMTEGPPKDEVFLYEDALRQGRTVIIALAKDDEQAESARRALAESGAESIDAARQRWWIGLRDLEHEHYTADGKNFADAESAYRRGFEAALHPETRGRSYEEAKERLRRIHPGVCDEEPFRRGYERGNAYFNKVWKK